MVNLETNYLGLRLRSPLMPSASPLTGNLDNLRRLEDAGASAIVLPSLFEEQLRHQFNDPSWSQIHGIEPYPPALSFFPDEEYFLASPDTHLARIAKVSDALSIPVIASLSGATPGEWTQFAGRMEEAGADAIELSIYDVPTDFETDAAGIENSHLRMVADVRRQISIPLAVKLSPFYTNFPHFAQRLVNSGANGLVLFNRLFSAEIELEHADLNHAVRRTTSTDVDLPVRWVALLHERLQASLAATSGVHSGQDALKLISAGADVTMLCSALMVHGIEHLKTVESEMREWLETHGHQSLNHVRGIMSTKQCPERSALERANYIWAVGDFTPSVKRETL